MADAAADSPFLPPLFADWFAAQGWSPRPYQLEMVARAREGCDALLIAPTGGGKTLAGFLPSLVELAGHPRAARRGVHTLYISPLKALAVDVERNLARPIREMGLDIIAESRTGDTGVARRQRQKVLPPDILLTTPEQLALFCAWEGSRLYFEDLACVVIDEIHALHASKRGDLLSLGLSRLAALAPRLRRTGLSATVDDPAVIQRWMGDGERPVELVRGPPGATPQVDLLLSGGRTPWAGHTAQHAMAEVYAAIRASRTTLVFVNTRFQAEFAFQELWKLNEENLPIALHHGSLAAEQRRKVEAAMARGELKAVVCTSTLDLGIDWGDVDLVIQLASPKGASRWLARPILCTIRLDEPSRALFVPANRFEVLECQAARECIAENRLDGEPLRTGALDVLAQHLLGCACAEPVSDDALFDEVRRAGPYRDLSREDFDRTLDLTATGGYALQAYDRFRRMVRGPDGLWRVRNADTARRHRLNLGVILSPDVLSVRVAQGSRLVGGRKIGEIEEGYFEMLDPGDTFVFAGQVWSLAAITGLDVLVRPARSEDPNMPSWGGSKFALSSHLARRVRRMMSDEAAWVRLPSDVREWLGLQRLRSRIVAEDDMLVETFPRGRRHFLVAYPFEGRLAHTTLAMLLTRRLERAGAQPLGFVCNDYALAVWSLKPMDSLDMDDLFAQDMLGDDLEDWLAESFMMKRAFKGCAIIAGLIERRFPGEPRKTGRQVTFSTDLIYDVLRRHQPDHLLLHCARQEAAEGMIDAARLGDLLARVAGRIRHVALERLSPFAVPMLVEIGKERSPGQAGDAILAEAGSDLIAEALA